MLELVATEPKQVAEMLAHWHKDPDLAPIRDGDELPETLHSFWEQVDALRQRASAAGK